MVKIVDATIPGDEYPVEQTEFISFLDRSNFFELFPESNEDDFTLSFLIGQDCIINYRNSDELSLAEKNETEFILDKISEFLLSLSDEDRDGAYSEFLVSTAIFTSLQSLLNFETKPNLSPSQLEEELLPIAKFINDLGNLFDFKELITQAIGKYILQFRNSTDYFYPRRMAITYTCLLSFCVVDLNSLTAEQLGIYNSGLELIVKPYPVLSTTMNVAFVKRHLSEQQLRGLKKGLIYERPEYDLMQFDEHSAFIQLLEDLDIYVESGAKPNWKKDIKKKLEAIGVENSKIKYLEDRFKKKFCD